MKLKLDKFSLPLRKIENQKVWHPDGINPGGMRDTRSLRMRLIAKEKAMARADGGTSATGAADGEADISSSGADLSPSSSPGSLQKRVPRSPIKSTPSPIKSPPSPIKSPVRSPTSNGGFKGESPPSDRSKGRGARSKKVTMPPQASRLGELHPSLFDMPSEAVPETAEAIADAAPVVAAPATAAASVIAAAAAAPAPRQHMPAASVASRLYGPTVASCSNHWGLSELELSSRYPLLAPPKRTSVTPDTSVGPRKQLQQDEEYGAEDRPAVRRHAAIGAAATARPGSSYSTGSTPFGLSQSPGRRNGRQLALTSRGPNMEGIGRPESLSLMIMSSKGEVDALKSFHNIVRRNMLAEGRYYTRKVAEEAAAAEKAKVLDFLECERGAAEREQAKQKAAMKAAAEEEAREEAKRVREAEMKMREERRVAVERAKLEALEAARQAEEAARMARLHATASRIQARQRGIQGRAKAERAREEARLAAAATQIQARQRGKEGRAKAERARREALEAARLAAEAARLAAEKAEAERRAALLEAERLKRARLEAERLEAERLEAERARIAAEATAKAEAERAEAAAKAEAQRLERERLAAERAARERAEREDKERRERELTLIVSAISAYGVPAADKARTSDPYVLFTLLNGRPGVAPTMARTRPVYNNLNPVYLDEVQLLLRAGSAAAMDRAPQLRVRVYDKDLTGVDELLGEAEVTLSFDPIAGDARYGAIDKLLVQGVGDFAGKDCTVSFRLELSTSIAPAATLLLSEIKASGLPEPNSKGGKSPGAKVRGAKSAGAKSMGAVPGAMGALQDPYIRFSLLETGEEDLDSTHAGGHEATSTSVVTPTIQNATKADWGTLTLTLELPRGSARPPLLALGLWDEDTRSDDDALAFEDVRLNAAGGVHTVKLIGRKGSGMGKHVHVEFKAEFV